MEVALARNAIPTSKNGSVEGMPPSPALQATGEQSGYDFRQFHFCYTRVYARNLPYFPTPFPMNISLLLTCPRHVSHHSPVPRCYISESLCQQRSLLQCLQNAVEGSDAKLSRFDFTDLFCHWKWNKIVAFINVLFVSLFARLCSRESAKM